MNPEAINFSVTGKILPQLPSRLPETGKQGFFHPVPKNSHAPLCIIDADALLAGIKSNDSKQVQALLKSGKLDPSFFSAENLKEACALVKQNKNLDIVRVILKFTCETRFHCQFTRENYWQHAAKYLIELIKYSYPVMELYRFALLGKPNNFYSPCYNSLSGGADKDLNLALLVNEKCIANMEIYPEDSPEHLCSAYYFVNQAMQMLNEKNYGLSKPARDNLKILLTNNPAFLKAQTVLLESKASVDPENMIMDAMILSGEFPVNSPSFN